MQTPFFKLLFFQSLYNLNLFSELNRATSCTTPQSRGEMLTCVIAVFKWLLFDNLREPFQLPLIRTLERVITDIM